MARPRKKRKYVKQSAYWDGQYRLTGLPQNQTVAVGDKIAIKGNTPMAGNYVVKSVYPPKPCTKPYASRTEAALAARNAASNSTPYVCATCGEWHARLRG